MLVIMGMNMKTMGIGFVKTFAKMFVVTLEGLISFFAMALMWYRLRVERASARKPDASVTESA